MLRYYHAKCSALLVVICLSAFGQADEREAIEHGAQITLEPEDRVEQVTAEAVEEKVGPALLSMSVRFDTQFTAGNGTTPGFSLPSLRLAAFGEISKELSYRVSFGQTREFSSAMLPQLIPMEAYVQITPESMRDTYPSLAWRVGMMTPSLNPLWSPDLAYIPLPSYHDVHRSLLLPPDLGTEVIFSPFGPSLTAGIGYFNGNGNFSLNVNNSKAITGFIRYYRQIGKAVVSVGVGGYGTQQSTARDPNFISNWMQDWFLSLSWGRLEMSLDFLSGRFEDSVRIANPKGAAGYLSFEFTPWLRLFTRLERLDSPPESNSTLWHGQAGPSLRITESLTGYLLYDYRQGHGGDIENTFQFRARLRL